MLPDGALKNTAPTRSVVPDPTAPVNSRLAALLIVIEPMSVDTPARVAAPMVLITTLLSPAPAVPEIAPTVSALAMPVPKVSVTSSASVALARVMVPVEAPPMAVL